MTFFDKWIKQFDLFMEYVLIALTAGVLVACFSAKVKVRYLIGSIIFGCICGAVGQTFFTSEALSIGVTIVGVLTAPLTIAKLSGMTLWEALDEIRSKADKK